MCLYHKCIILNEEERNISEIYLLFYSIQVSHAARLALERGDLTVACKLFLYIIESNECRDHTITATEYTSQLADLLLNVFINYPENLAAIEKFPDLLLAALELILTGK